MRKLLTITSVLLLTIAFAMAKGSNTSNSQMSPEASPIARTMTIQGCLSSANSGYALTDSQGNVWTLEGSTGQLKNDVGHTVALTGRGGDAAFLTGNGEKYIDVDMASIADLHVASVKQISTGCSAQGTQYARHKAADMLAAG
jgi:hypothetical protein